MLDEALEKCTSIRGGCVNSGKNLLCKAEDVVQHKPLLSLGIAALVGGIIDTVVSRLNH